jgi:hypothetical protein
MTGPSRATRCPIRWTPKSCRTAARFFKDGEKMQLSYAVQNTHRTIGTRTSSHIVQNFGMRNTPAARPPDGDADRAPGKALAPLPHRA